MAKEGSKWKIKTSELSVSYIFICYLADSIEVTKMEQ
jgi:hypothetical protein